MRRSIRPPRVPDPPSCVLLALQEQCLLVQDFFACKRSAADEGCTLEQAGAAAAGAPSCGDLTCLMDMARETYGHGDSADLYQVLKIMHKHETQPSSPAAPPAAAAAAAPAAAATSKHSSKRSRLVALFHAIDTNHNGMLDLADFNTAMHTLGIPMGAIEMEQLADALGIAGSVSLDEFLMAADAGQHMLKTAAAQRGTDGCFLRALGNAAPAWWSEPPPSMVVRAL